MKSLLAYTKIIFILFWSNVYLSHQTYDEANATVIHKWKNVTIEYPSEAAKQEAIRNGSYVPENVLVMDYDNYSTNFKQLF